MLMFQCSSEMAQVHDVVFHEAETVEMSMMWLLTGPNTSVTLGGGGGV